jgi:hypothetical protein
MSFEGLSLDGYLVPTRAGPWVNPFLPTAPPARPLRSSLLSGNEVIKLYDGLSFAMLEHGVTMPQSPCSNDSEMPRPWFGAMSDLGPSFHHRSRRAGDPIPRATAVSTAHRRAPAVGAMRLRELREYVMPNLIDGLPVDCQRERLGD